MYAWPQPLRSKVRQRKNYLKQWGTKFLVQPWFQASAPVLMRSALFWDITYRRVVIVNQRFGTTSVHQRFGTTSVHQRFGTTSVHQRFGTTSVHQHFGTTSVHQRFGTTSVNNCHMTMRNIPEERRYYEVQFYRISTTLCYICNLSAYGLCPYVLCLKWIGVSLFSEDGDRSCPRHVLIFTLNKVRWTKYKLWMT
jgi:hypothetical protein